MNEGKKDDKGKLRWDLLPLPLVEKLVEVYTFGAKKYAPNTWQNLDDGYNRYKAAMLRHLTAYEKGETIDPDSKLNHLYHTAWNALALIHFAEKSKSQCEHPPMQVEPLCGKAKYKVGDFVGFNKVPNVILQVDKYEYDSKRQEYKYYSPALGWYYEHELKQP